MKRWLKYTITVCVFLAGFSWATIWLLGTPEGARWLLRMVSRWSSVKIETERVSGRIAGELHLEGINIYWPEGRMEIDKFLVHWQLVDLFLGKITLQDVNLDRVRLQDNSPESKTSPDLTLPKIPGPPVGLHLEIRSFRLNELIYRRLDRSYFKVVNISGHLSWHRGLIKTKHFVFESPNGHAELKGELNFLKPFLTLDLGFSPKNPLMGMNFLSMSLHLLPAHLPERMAGKMLIKAKLGTMEDIELKGEIGITSNALKLRRLFLSQPGRGGTVAADGELNFSPEKPFFQINVKLRELDISRDLSVATTVSGHIDVEGGLANYHGSFDLRNTQKGWHEAHLIGTFQGDFNRIRVAIPEGTLLDGTLEGQAEASWQKGFSIVGALMGRKLDPSKITSEWKGQINLNLNSNFSWTETSPPKGKLTVHLLESHLRGKALTGDIDAELDRGILHLRKGELRGKGFYLFSQGVLRDRLNFDVQVSDLSGLIPGTRGSFFANGWARLRNQHLSGSLKGQGKGLSLAGAQVQSVNVTARLDEGEKGVVDLKAKAQGLAYDFIQMDSASLKVTGTVGSHKGEIAIQWPDGDAQGIFAGVYTKEGWEGIIYPLTGNHPRGRPWSLKNPVAANVSMGKLKLTPFAMVSQTGEKVQISADLTLHPIHGFLEVEWQQVDLWRASPYLGKPQLFGDTTGELKVQWPGEDRVRLNAMVNVTGTLHDSSMKLELSHGSVNLRWTEKGLETSWKMELTGGGKLQGQLSSSQPGRLGFPEQGKFLSNWKAIDLAILKHWLPSDLTLEGRSSGRLSGHWGKGWRFETAGKMDVSQGLVQWRTKEGLIGSKLQTADLNWSWRDDELNGTLSLALADYGELNGKFQLPFTPSIPTGVRKTGPIFVSLQSQIQEKGLLPSFFPDLIQESSGQVDLKLNAYGTWEKPRLEATLSLKRASIRVLMGRSSGKEKTPEARESLKLERLQGMTKLNWDEKGLFASWKLELAEGGKAHGQLSSPHPARFALPPQGKLDVTWEGINLNKLRPWLPPPLTIEGHLAGRLDGQWMAGLHLNVNGGVKISQGSFIWKGKNGEMRVRLKTADLNLTWQEEQLAGELSLVLEKYGHAKGNFKLPLAARLPPDFQVKGPVFLFLEAQVQEKGLVQTLFPDWIQESQGMLGLNITASGTWKEPRMEGHLKLTGAGAYLPTAGVHIKELGAEVLFTGDQIRVTSFQARSGQGQIEGTAFLRLRDQKISHFEGRLKGDRFQTVYLPELQVLISPHLNFERTGEKLAVRGEILIPELLLLDRQTEGVIRPSPDVVIVDEKEALAPSVAFPLDIQVRVILGDKVLVKAEGIDARLTGDLSIRGENSKEMAARGEIQAVQGHYNAYGQKLEITRGRLLFNGPADRPTLDVLALRKIGRGFEEVQAGVTVTGPIRSPLIRLYSKPAMPETDILSYIVLGHPLSKGSNKEQTTLLMEAAGALLSTGESVLLKNQLSSRLGIDTLDIQTGGGDISRSLVTVGKYLNPRLYVGLGGSLFTNTYQIILRYSLTKSIELESKTGTVSGANIYFKVEFD
jgi:translocation and assembly module TamB